MRKSKIRFGSTPAPERAFIMGVATLLASSMAALGGCGVAPSGEGAASSSQMGTSCRALGPSGPDTPNLFDPNSDFSGEKYAGYSSEYTRTWEAGQTRSHDLGVDINLVNPSLPPQHGYGGEGTRYLMAREPAANSNGRPYRLWCSPDLALTVSQHYWVKINGTMLQDAGERTLTVWDRAPDAGLPDGGESNGTPIGTLMISFDETPNDWASTEIEYVASGTPRQICLSSDGHYHFIAIDDLEMRSYCGDGLCEQAKGEDAHTCLADCHCGNGACEPALGEDSRTCTIDCGSCQSNADCNNGYWSTIPGGTCCCPGTPKSYCSSGSCLAVDCGI